jgi:uncharacterized damage-inducible protein DinB
MNLRSILDTHHFIRRSAPVAKTKKVSAARKRVPARRAAPAKTVKAARKAAPTAKTAKARGRARPATAPPAHSPKREFLNRFNQEHATTLRVIRAFPADQHAFQPHPRSNTAKNLIWTFAVEQAIGARLAAGGGMPTEFPQAPESFDDVVAAYRQGVEEIRKVVEEASDTELAEIVPFFRHEMPAIDMLWLLLLDSIHHRGQLSVYVRMAGGKVPSIYGPSADDPGM